MIDPPRSRPYWVEFGVGLGFVGFSLLVLQFALTARFRGIGRPFGIDTLLQFHRQAGLVAVAFILAHPVILILVRPGYMRFFDPRVNFGRAAALTLVTVLLVLLVATTLWRVRFRLPYEWWRLLHGIAALLVVFIGLAHMLRVGHYVEPLWKQAFWILLTGTSVALLLYARVFKPLRMGRRPWRITNIQPQRDASWTLTLEPDAHRGFIFQPGQYAWLTVGDTPFTLQQHPFSFSSSQVRAPQEVELTIKEFGDFTRSMKDVRPGTRAFLEGPYGAFSLEDASPGAVFLAGGIGITPIMSILRTARDRSDKRPFVLLYGNPAWDRATFREELEDLAQQINLKVVHVIEHPPEGWTGEVGLLTEEMIRAHIEDRSVQEWPFFICGPPAMMNAVEPALRRLGVPMSHIRSERFDIV